MEISNVIWYEVMSPRPSAEDIQTMTAMTEATLLLMTVNQETPQRKIIETSVSLPVFLIKGMSPRVKLQKSFC